MIYKVIKVFLAKNIKIYKTKYYEILLFNDIKKKILLFNDKSLWMCMCL